MYGFYVAVWRRKLEPTNYSSKMAELMEGDAGQLHQGDVDIKGMETSIVYFIQKIIKLLI